jgi:chemotaxis protein CheX
MDVTYINPFVTAAQAVFKSMLGLEIERAKPVIREVRTASGDVTGIMGLVGDRKGTVTISFRTRGALFVFRTLIGEECDNVTPEVLDSIGEVTNIISGQARREFEKASINLKGSIPMVVAGKAGKEVEMNFITQGPIVSLPFHFSVGDGVSEIMYLDVSFE